MKKHHINKKLIFKICTFALSVILLTTFLCMCVSAASMGLPSANGRNGMADPGNNQNGIMSDTHNHPKTDGGNLGDTDGDGVVEDKGNSASHGNGIVGDIVDDVKDGVRDIESDMRDSGKTNKDMHRNAQNGSESGAVDGTNQKGTSVVGIIIAVIIAIAVILLIIALIPKNRNKDR